MLVSSQDNPSALVLADVDGDGRKDALVAHNASLGVYRQFPNGDFLAEELYTIPSASTHQLQGLAVGDINGDGRPDAVIADYNRGLIVLRHVPETALALAITAPAAGGTYYTGLPLTTRWTTGDTIELASFDVSVGYSGGFGLYTYTPVAGCTGLPPTSTECVWTPTSASASPVRVRVTARNAQGQTTFTETSFTLVTPMLSPSAPSAPLLVGTTATISWQHNLLPNDTVRIELTRDSGASYETLAAAVPISLPTNTTAGTFNWTVTGPATTTARWRVTPNGFQPAPLGTTSQNFAITTTPTLTVFSPGAGSTYYTNSVSASWTSNAGNVGTVSVELSRDGGATFQTIVASMPNTGSFSGSVPGPSADDARFRVTLTISGLETVTGISNSFKLFYPEVAVTSPAAGSTLFVGTPVAITWSSNVPANWSARVELSRNGGSTYEVLTTVSNTGSFNWVVTGAVTSAALVRLTVYGGGSASATSGTFAIAAPSVTVTSPAAGAAFYAGTPLAITWSTNLPASSPVTVELSRNGGSTYEVLATGAPNTGSFGWIATGPGTAAAVARVTIGGPGTTSATSGVFGIVEPSLTLTGPAAGVAVYAGTPLAITWSANLPTTSPVLVELSRDGGVTFETLAAAAPNTGRFDWVAAGPDSSAVVARVTMADPVALTSTSGAFCDRDGGADRHGSVRRHAGVGRYAGDDHLDAQSARRRSGVDRIEPGWWRDVRGPRRRRGQHRQLRLDGVGSRHRAGARTGHVARRRLGERRRCRVPDREPDAGGDVADRGRELGDRDRPNDLVDQQPRGGDDGAASRSVVTPGRPGRRWRRRRPPAAAWPGPPAARRPARRSSASRRTEACRRWRRAARSPSATRRCP